MSENHFALDDTDRKILRILAVNGRINNLALAEAVNLSPTIKSTCTYGKVKFMHF